MKHILLVLLLLPCLTYAGNYTYTKVNSVEGGSDNFNISQSQTNQKAGTIFLEKKVMRIDDKEYTLKPTNQRNQYRIKGGVARLIYNAGDLVQIELYQYNQVAKYKIGQVAAATTNEKH